MKIKLTSVEKWVMKHMNFSLEDILLNRKWEREHYDYKNKLSQNK